MEPIEQQLTALSTDLKAFAAKAQEETKSLGAIATETKTGLETIRAKMGEMQTQLDAIDAKGQQRHLPTGGESKSLGQRITEAQEYLDRKGHDFTSRKELHFDVKSEGALERKTNITEGNLGTGTSGLLMPVRLPGMSILAQQALRIRDLMNIVPQTTGSSFDFVTQVTRTNAASPQQEAVAKAQSYINYTATIGSIRTIAHYVKVSKQALSDVAFLRGQIDGELIYGVKVKEESEILAGDGTGVHLNGLITQATAFDTSLLVATAGWSRLDILRLAKLQARLAGLATYAPSAFVLNPTDLARLELTKNTQGNYLIGDPKTGADIPMVWNLPVVESDSITAGTFLVGAFNTAADLVDREAISVEISFEDGTNFTENMATVLCEERIGLAVKKAAAFITGSFTTSPATQN